MQSRYRFIQRELRVQMSLAAKMGVELKHPLVRGWGWGVFTVRMKAKMFGLMMVSCASDR